MNICILQTSFPILLKIFRNFHEFPIFYPLRDDFFHMGWSKQGHPLGPSPSFLTVYSRSQRRSKTLADFQILLSEVPDELHWIKGLVVLACSSHGIWENHIIIDSLMIHFIFHASTLVSFSHLGYSSHSENHLNASSTSRPFQGRAGDYRRKGGSSPRKITSIQCSTAPSDCHALLIGDHAGHIRVGVKPFAANGQPDDRHFRLMLDRIRGAVAVVEYDVVAPLHSRSPQLQQFSIMSPSVLAWLDVEAM